MGWERIAELNWLLVDWIDLVGYVWRLAEYSFFRSRCLQRKGT